MVNNNTSFAATNSNALSILPSLSWEAILSYNIYLAISLALGSLVNLMVLFVYCKNGIAHTTDWFIIYIGIFDFISAFLNVPVYLTFTTGLWSRFGNDIICKIHMTFGQFTVIASPLLIGGLALERYFKVCRPTTTRLSKDGSRNSCMTISVMTFVVSLPCIALYDDSNGNCDFILTDTVILVDKIYYMAVVAVFIMLFIMVIFCYANIAITILRSKKNLGKYTVPTTDDSERRFNCFHVMCCIYRSDTSTAPYVNTTEIYVLPESSTSSEKVHDRNKLAKPAKPGNQEKGIKIQNKKSRTNKSLRTTRITFIVCLIFLISWIPPWVGFAIDQFAATETKRATPYRVYKLFADMSFLINTFTNPFIYVLMDRTFRKNIRKSFVCIKC